MSFKKKTFLQRINDINIPGPGCHSPKLGKSLVSRLYFVRDILWLLAILIPHLLLAVYEWIIPRAEEDLTGKVVVVTGAGGGLGRQLCLRFAKLNSQVVCVDIAKAANEETLKQITKTTSNKNCMAVNCDLSDPDACRHLAEQVVNKYKRVDILLHGAAILAVNSFEDVSDHYIRKVMDVNLLAPFWLIRAFLPYMKEKRQGHIVVINSMINYFNIAYTTLYTASKGGLRGLTNALIEELRDNEETKNIKVTSVHPWLMNTFNHNALSEVSSSRFGNDNVQKAMLSPEESARQIIVGIRRGYERFCIPGIRITDLFVGQLLSSLPKEFKKVAMSVVGVTKSLPKGQSIVATNSQMPTTKADKEKTK